MNYSADTYQDHRPCHNQRILPGLNYRCHRVRYSFAFSENVRSLLLIYSSLRSVITFERFPSCIHKYRSIRHRLHPTKLTPVDHRHYLQYLHCFEISSNSKFPLFRYRTLVPILEVMKISISPSLLTSPSATPPPL